VIAVDTNVVVRLLTGDDKSQQARAERLFRDHEIFIGATVFLESEWVLRFSYGYDPARIRDAFKKLLGLDNVSASHPSALAMALERYARGLDFADALHLALAGDCERFATFDARFIKKAQTLTGPQVFAP